MRYNRPRDRWVNRHFFLCWFNTVTMEIWNLFLLCVATWKESHQTCHTLTWTWINQKDWKETCPRPVRNLIRFAFWEQTRNEVGKKEKSVWSAENEWFSNSVNFKPEWVLSPQSFQLIFYWHIINFHSVQVFFPCEFCRKWNFVWNFSNATKLSAGTILYAKHPSVHDYMALLFVLLILMTCCLLLNISKSFSINNELFRLFTSHFCDLFSPKISCGFLSSVNDVMRIPEKVLVLLGCCKTRAARKFYTQNISTVDQWTRFHQKSI